MSMCDEYRTRAAEFQAIALRASEPMERRHLATMAERYLQLAEVERQIDCLCAFYQEARVKQAS